MLHITYLTLNEHTGETWHQSRDTNRGRKTPSKVWMVTRFSFWSSDFPSLFSSSLLSNPMTIPASMASMRSAPLKTATLCVGWLNWKRTGRSCGNWGAVRPRARRTRNVYTTWGRRRVIMWTGGECHLVKHVATFSRLTPTEDSRSFIRGALHRTVKSDYWREEGTIAIPMRWVILVMRWLQVL